MHEVSVDPDMLCTIEYCNTTEQKGDRFTKASTPAMFEEAMRLIGMRATKIDENIGKNKRHKKT